jgi:hypothetical protein
VKEDYLKLIQIEQYKLVSYFSRKNYGHGGSCLYVKKRICTKELNCIQGISMEKDSEMSAIELVDYGYIIICLYRSPDSNFWIFIKNLELIIQSTVKKKLFLCGHWNLNFVEDNVRVQEVQNLLECYNFINMVRSTRITSSTESLIDVIIINKDNLELRANVVDLGFCDHLAQKIRICISKRNRRTRIVIRRQLIENSVEKFKNLVSNQLWDEVFNHSDVNSSLKAFMDIFCTVLIYKRVKSGDSINKRWLSQGLIVSSQRMKVLNSLKRKFTLTKEAVDYIKIYQKIYKEVLREAKKKKDNDRYVMESTDKPKAMWKLINKEIGKAPENDHKLELRIGKKII